MYAVNPCVTESKILDYTNHILLSQQSSMQLHLARNIYSCKKLQNHYLLI